MTWADGAAAASSITDFNATVTAIYAMDPKPLDAIIFKSLGDGVLASRVVAVANIAWWEERGWRVLIREDHVRYADWMETLMEEQRKWRKGQ